MKKRLLLLTLGFAVLPYSSSLFAAVASSSHSTRPTLLQDVEKLAWKSTYNNSRSVMLKDEEMMGVKDAPSSMLRPLSQQNYYYYN